MRVYIAGTIVLLFAILLIPGAPAASVTFTANQSDYFFATGQDAALSLPVTSTYSGEIKGTVRITTIGQLQNAGTVLTITKNSVYPVTLPQGNSYFNFSAGTSAKTASVKVRVAYQYTQGAPVLVTLPDLNVHFVQNLSLYAGLSGNPVASSSGAGLPGGLGNTSVQLSPRFVSPQNQSGRDVATSYSPSSSLLSQNGQMFQDTSALKAQIAQAAAQQAINEDRFNANLAADPLFQKVNATLATDGFFRKSATTNPTDSGNGTFAMTYQNMTGSPVSLSGSLVSGVVPLITEQSFSFLNVTPALSANATYQAFSRELTGAGFQRNQTLMNVTLSGETVNVIYLSGQDGPGFVKSVVEQGNVTQISLERPGTGMTAGMAEVAVTVFVLLFAGIWLVARYGKKRNNPRAFPVTATTTPVKESPDYRAETLHLLDDADAAFARQEYKNAYSLAGRAARLWFSGVRGRRGELTNSDIRKIFAAAGPEAERAGFPALLDRCSDVAFARGSPDAGEFYEMTNKIRGCVSSGSNFGAGKEVSEVRPDTGQ